MTKNRKITIAVVVAIIILILAAAGIVIYKKVTSLSGGDGIYYSQQDENKYLQFKEDGSFYYTVRTDKNTEEINSGKWTEGNNKITLTFDETNTSHIFLKSDDGYLYRENKIYRGKPGDAKLLNNCFVLEEDEKKTEEIWFLDDGTVDYQIIGNSEIFHGTYTRVDNVLIVRFNKNPNVPQRFLVLENGITKDFFHKNPPANIAQ